MPEISYLIEYTLDDRLRVEFITEQGHVRDFVVQYERYLDGEYRPVVRYDRAHGRPHRDILDHSGRLVRKDWLPRSTTLADALTDALDDLQVRWPEYRDRFLEGKP